MPTDTDKHIKASDAEAMLAKIVAQRKMWNYARQCSGCRDAYAEGQHKVLVDVARDLTALIACPTCAPEPMKPEPQQPVTMEQRAAWAAQHHNIGQTTFRRFAEMLSGRDDDLVRKWLAAKVDEGGEQ